MPDSMPIVSDIGAVALTVSRVRTELSETAALALIDD
jgi:hypothetical protein